MKYCKRSRLRNTYRRSIGVSVCLTFVALVLPTSAEDATLNAEASAKSDATSHEVAGKAATSAKPTRSDNLLQSPPTGRVLFTPTDAEPDVPKRFRLQGHTFPYWKSEESRFLGKVRVSNILFPSPINTPSEENNTVHCEYFAPVGTGKRPGVIVLHILGGDFELSRVICRTLATTGTGALFVKMPYYGPRRDRTSNRRMISASPAETVEGMTQAVMDIRRAVTWLESRQEIDTNELGIVGISLGGIVGSLSASIEPRFARACLVLAGGDFGLLAFESAELEDLRSNWAGPDVSIDDVRAMLKPIDPITYADRLKGREILMMNAKFDEVIPRKCTEALWKRCGEPEIVWWDAGHYTAALFLPAGLGRMSIFFGNREEVELARKATDNAQ